MKHIVVLGAGLGGMPMAFELQSLLKRDERLTVIAKGDSFHFTPSNPWAAVQWRKRADIEVPIAPVMAKKGIDFISAEAKRLHPERNEIELNDGRTVAYDLPQPMPHRVRQAYLNCAGDLFRPEDE